MSGKVKQKVKLDYRTEIAYHRARETYQQVYLAGRPKACKRCPLKDFCSGICEFAVTIETH